LREIALNCERILTLKCHRYTAGQFVSQKRNWKLVGVVNHVLDRMGSQFYAFMSRSFLDTFCGENSKKYLE